ncbi:hypothetical protein CXB51_018780 [Gossypium anomalum]|uniref:Reverse transcriptase Ty1/copia-type domain-containing protein n=1 Tax=Gossypium anomalum TaxID=47600 RepID=A0A8J6D1K7_9ROSI|nr:hypothetical protein CXB51_018780 [Gossypium anomalum]
METFAPVARLETIKLMFALAAQKQWKIHQLDVKSAFLNGFLKEEIYIEQSDGFKVLEEEDKVHKLKKALYGLKLAPRAWYDRVDAYLSRLRFEKSLNEPTLYVKKSEDETLLIVSIYVDDLLVTGSKSDLINDFKNQMQEVFDMTDLGIMTYFLGMEVNQSDQATRPDLIHAVSLLSRFMHYCDTTHFKVAKRIPSDWAGSVNDMKSTSAEAEYIATAAAVNQAIWLKKLLCDLNEEQLEPTEIKVDNQSIVAIAKNPVFHGKTKHFKIKSHFVREAEQSKEVNLIHCSSQDQLADILTKPLGTIRFEVLREMIGVCCIQSNKEC